MFLSDRDIRELIEKGELVIEPLLEDTIRENGLDLHIGYEYCVIRGSRQVYVDTREYKATITEFIGPYKAVERQVPVETLYDCRKVGQNGKIVIEPYSHVLLTTLEKICMPRDVIGLVNLRSTFARYGTYIPPTIIDAGFCGQVTIELIGSAFNTILYPGQRFLHVVLAKTMSPVEKPYNGKYQGQMGVTLPKPDR